MKELDFDSGSMEATEDFLSSAYTPMRVGGKAASTRTRVVRHAAGGLVVDRLSLDYTMAYDAGCLNRVCLVTMAEGTPVDTTGGAEEVFGPGDTFLLAPHDRPYSGEVRSARYTITMFDPALLGQVSTADGPVALTGARAVSADANRLLGSAVAHVLDHVLTDPDVDAHPMLVANAARYLASATLRALPHSAPDREAGDGRDATSRTVRAAVAYIEENADRDITLADIAACVPVSPRAVQYAFARHLDSTPLAHLRRVRLALAHADLKAAEPGTATVTSVAMRWGFAHPGRFAAAYRSAYGRAPSSTLRA
ncbi:helix-turn-helix transcriptional regulator [Streptomyces sp. NPDC059083]|uniref:helix-turn-helix transcriptional regulator n=1 Tax=unclassified Streptomyces TaxID=2593676 RepID=UPI0036828095